MCGHYLCVCGHYLCLCDTTYACVDSTYARVDTTYACVDTYLCVCASMRGSVDDGVEETMRIHLLRGEGLPAVSY